MRGDRYHKKNISQQVMTNWMIQCADRYLEPLYDYLHNRITVSMCCRPMRLRSMCVYSAWHLEIEEC